MHAFAHLRLAVRMLALLAMVAFAGPAAADTFVIVHGAFQDASAWSQVSGRLRRAGHRTILIELPGRDALGADVRALSLNSYRDAVLAAMTDVREPVVLVGHSFGGMTISAVAEAAPDRIARLVYVAAYLPISGESMQDLAGRDRGNRFTEQNFVTAPDFSWAEVLRRDRALIFAQDGTCGVRRAVEAGLRREPLAPMASKITVTPERFGRVPKAYLRTLRDNAVSPMLQDMMIARTPVAEVIPLNTGHAPMLTAPAALARALIEAAR